MLNDLEAFREVNQVFQNDQEQPIGEMQESKRKVRCCGLPGLSGTAKKNLKIAGKVALGVGIVAVVAGAALLAYMHFSGLGINQAGFTALGAKIKAFWDATHTMSKGQVFLEVILPTVGGLGVTGLLIAKRKPIGHKINLQKEKYWTWASGVWTGRVEWSSKDNVSKFMFYQIQAFAARAADHLDAVQEKIEEYNQPNDRDLSISDSD